MTAIILRSLSYSVHILERSSSSTLQSQAAGIRAGPELHSFISTHVPNFDPEYAIAPDVFEIVRQSGEVEMAIPPADPLRLTTWKKVYDMLLSTFLGEKNGDGDGKAVYETKMKVEDVREEGDGKVLVTYRNLEDDTTKTVQADLVIAADGAHSTVRRIISSDDVEAPRYAGYVTWRGRVPEEDVSQETRAALQNRCVLMRVQDGYMISYVQILQLIQLIHSH
jgi:2-polyprenyl-6-methoxyphenol hydroxylase-like FAD-dependent oxidoreductase